jgi:hypothetical protein
VEDGCSIESKSSGASLSQKRFHEDKSPDGNDTCEDEGDDDEEDDLLQAIEDLTAKVDGEEDAEEDCKEQDQDQGQLDEKALAKLKEQQENEQEEIEQRKNEFMEIDFHPYETRPAGQFMYSAYFEQLRHTMNSYLRRPIKKQFVTNSKKCVLTVVRGENRTIDEMYTLKGEVPWR